MLKFRKFIRHIQEREDPCSQEQFQIRHGGWITETQAILLFGEGLTGPGERSQRVKANAVTYNKIMRQGLKHFHDTYGPADDRPAKPHVLAARIKNRFAVLDDMKKNNPKKYKETMEAAKDKMTMANGSKLGHPIANNSKTKVGSEVSSPDAPRGHTTASMAFTPDTARHYNSSAHTSTGDFEEGKHYSERDVCAGSKEGCRIACLAKTGNYGFDSNKARMDLRTQRLTHNQAATEHHADLVHGLLTKQSEKENPILLRPAVSDDMGPTIHNPGIRQSFPNVTNMAYTKNRPKGIHDPNGKEQTTVSDPGPMVTRSEHPKTGEVTKSITDGNKENINDRRLRASLPDVATHPSYMVFNKHRGDEENGNNIDHLKRVRRYEPDPSTPEHGEKDDYHHPDGYGRVSHNGHSYRYQDHSVVRNARTTDGKSLRPYEHDTRIPSVDVPKEKLKTRSGHAAGGIIPSLSVKSTNKRELQDSSFFHHAENIDHDGVYHDGHPAEMEKAGHEIRKPGYVKKSGDTRGIVSFKGKKDE